MDFYLIAHATHDGILMTLGTGIGIEQRAQTVCRVEDHLKSYLPVRKVRLLIRCQISQRVSELRLFFCRAAPKNKETRRQCDRNPCWFHRFSQEPVWKDSQHFGNPSQFYHSTKATNIISGDLLR